MNTNENLKELLLKDLCGRLPYGVIVAYKNRENKDGRVKLGYGSIGYVAEFGRGWWTVCKPYLRPMSSMTEEEKQEYEATCPDWDETLKTYDWLNAHHFDYRGFIERGLALEAPEGMYNMKEK